jgi:hypothetical protein
MTRPTQDAFLSCRREVFEYETPNLDVLSASYLHVPIVQRPRTWPFQGQNTGSNPVGDAT